MAATVSANLSLIDDAESATTWSTGAVDPDFFVQNQNSIGWYGSKNARGSVTVTPGTSVAWSTYTYPHLYFWTASSVAAKMENKSTGTTTASGVTVRVTLANNAYREWHVTGADYWAGEWRCFVVDMSHTGTQLYASSGTFSNASNIASVTFYYDLSNSGNIRNVPANIWNDVVRVGEGLTAYSPNSTTPIDFADIAAEDEAVANKYGVLQTIDGIIFCQGKLTVGDSAGTNHVDFASENEVLVFSERNGSGLGLTNANLYGVDFVGNSTATTQDIRMGIGVGTGDAKSGRNGTQIIGAAGVGWALDMADAEVHSFEAYGSTFRGAELGITATGSPTTFEIAGCTFDGCDEIDTRDAITRNCNFLNTTATATEGALLWDESESDVEFCLFVNNVVGVRIPTLAADDTFSGMTFSGNTNDIRYEGATDRNLNLVDGSNATSVTNTGAGTLTLVNSRTLTLTGLKNPTEVRVYDAGTTTEIAGQENVTTGTFTTGIDGATYSSVDIAVVSLGYQNLRLLGVSMATDQSIPISQVIDRQYFNPPGP